MCTSAYKNQSILIRVRHPDSYTNVTVTKNEWKLNGKFGWKYIHDIRDHGWPIDLSDIQNCSFYLSQSDQRRFMVDQQSYKSQNQIQKKFHQEMGSLCINYTY